MKRDSMIFYRSFYESLNGLDAIIKAEVYDAIFEYGLNFTEIQFSNPTSKALFTLIKPQLDANIKKWSSGNKPKVKQSASKTEAKDKHEESKVEANVNDNVNDNVNNKYNFSASLCEYGFNPELVKQWLIIRKQKKSVNSEISFKGFIREVEKSHLTKDEILQLCIEKSWKGFEASWIEKPKTEDWKQDKVYLLAKAQGYVK
jgi:hypothetical protein